MDCPNKSFQPEQYAFIGLPQGVQEANLTGRGCHIISMVELWAGSSTAYGERREWKLDLWARTQEIPKKDAVQSEHDSESWERNMIRIAMCSIHDLLWY